MKGFFFTISIFLLASAAVEFMAFGVEQRSRLRADYSYDAATLLLGLDGIRTVYLGASGAQFSLARNGTNVSIAITESGFPLSPSSGGRVPAAFISNYTRLAASLHNLSFSSNLTYMNTTGRLIEGNGANYTQDNSQAASDNATLKFPQGYGLWRAYVRMACSMPSATSVSNTTFGSSSGPSALDFAFTSVSPPSGATFQNSMINLSTNNSFTASYEGASGWLADVKISTIYNDSRVHLSVWTVLNTSAASKSDLNCTWNLTADINYTNTNDAIYQYIPMPINASYGGAHFIGNLSLSQA